MDWNEFEVSMKLAVLTCLSLLPIGLTIALITISVVYIFNRKHARVVRILNA